MIKKTITYKDFEGNEVKDTRWFNMSSVELFRFVAKYTTRKAMNRDDKEALFKTFQQVLNDYIKVNDISGIIEFVEDFILTSYGERTDNLVFLKNKSIRDEFACSIYYAELFEQVFTDEEKLKRFINGVIDIDNKKDKTKDFNSNKPKR